MSMTPEPRMSMTPEHRGTESGENAVGADTDSVRHFERPKRSDEHAANRPMGTDPGRYTCRAHRRLRRSALGRPAIVHPAAKKTEVNEAFFCDPAMVEAHGRCRRCTSRTPNRRHVFPCRPVRSRSTAGHANPTETTQESDAVGAVAVAVCLVHLDERQLVEHCSHKETVTSQVTPQGPKS